MSDQLSGDAMWNEGYAAGVQDSMLRATQYERIVTDLIAELYGYADSGVDSGWAPLYSTIDRAEARLREAQGE